MQTITLKPGDNIGTIKEKYGLGYLELTEANPGVDLRHPKAGMTLTLPLQHILPDAPREGIVINRSEPRLYYYPKNQSVVYTYPIGIGREGDETPEMLGKITEKEVDPIWDPPLSIRARELAKGHVLPARVYPGPDNPLGAYAMRISHSSFLIHGTNDPAGVGLRISSGCIRLFPKDIKELFSLVSVGTPVRIVDQPIKLGHLGNTVFIESHVPMEFKNHPQSTEIASLLAALQEELMEEKDAGEIFLEINQAEAEARVKAHRGFPEPIGSARHGRCVVEEAVRRP